MAVELLIGAKADVNVKNTSKNYSGTPLHMTAMGGGDPARRAQTAPKRAQIAQMLVAAGADLSVANDDGLLPWQLVSEGDAAVAPALLETLRC